MPPDPSSSWRIERYLAGDLHDEELAALDRELLHREDLRREFRAQVRLHGMLARHFARERVGEPAFATLAFPPLAESARAHRTWPRFAVATMVAIFAGLATLWVAGPGGSGAPLATVASADRAEWAKAGKAVEGEPIGRERRQLLSGFVSLSAPGGVELAIEAPASFRFLSETRLHLEAGQLSAQVPETAHGFTVETPEGEIIDLGTRFGVSVSGRGVEAHVFEGSVEVNHPNGQLPRRLGRSEAIDLGSEELQAADPDRFPMPAFPLAVDYGDGGFEQGGGFEPGIPKAGGKWGGDPAEGVGAFEGIVPAEGARMARFLAARGSGEGDTGQRASELWQLVNLSPFSDEVNRGGAVAKLKARFNRVAGGVATDRRFGIGITAFRGVLPEADDYWDRKADPLSERLAHSGAELISDDDPTSWETAACEFAVPPGTDFVMLQVFAYEDVSNDSENEFEGHFADDVSLTITTLARGSRPQAVWQGEGRWDEGTFWKGRKAPDPYRDRILIAGGEAIINGRVPLKQDLVVASEDGDFARLRVSPGGELECSGHGQLIVGFNPGSRGELIVEGTLRTRAQAFVGRNNAESRLIVDGGHWDAGDGLIRLSQYGHSGPDTVASLTVADGGRLSAGILELVHDSASLRIESGGRVEAGLLRLGGKDGKAEATIHDGTLRIERIEFGPGNGRLQLTSPEAVLELSGEWDEDALRSLPGANWGDAVVLRTTLYEHEGRQWTRIRRP